MTCFNGLQLWHIVFALIRDERATGMKSASGGWINWGWDVPFK